MKNFTLSLFLLFISIVGYSQCDSFGQVDGDISNGHGAEYLLGQSYFLPVNGIVDSLGIHSAEEGQIIIALYDDNNGAPGTLLTQSGETPLNVGHNVINVLDVELSSGEYWIMKILSTGTDISAQSSSPATVYYQGLPFGAPLPDEAVDFSDYENTYSFQCYMVVCFCTSSFGVDTQTACDSFTWIDGNTYTSDNASASYNIVGGNAEGCDSLVTLNLTVNTIDNELTVSDTNIIANTTGASYQWLDCDNAFSALVGDTLQDYSFIDNGNYAVEITENGCVDTSLCANITTVNIQDLGLMEEILIYPNPSTGKFNIDLGELQMVHLNLYNATGKLIYQEKNIANKLYQLDLNLVSGVYILELESEGKRQQFKLAKY